MDYVATLASSRLALANYTTRSSSCFSMVSPLPPLVVSVLSRTHSQITMSTGQRPPDEKSLLLSHFLMPAKKNFIQFYLRHLVEWICTHLSLPFACLALRVCSMTDDLSEP